MQRIIRPVLNWRVALCGLLTWGAVLLVGGPVRAQLYSLTDLGTLGGSRSSAATGINDAGQVVGWADTTGNAEQHAFIYSNGTMTDLGTLGGTRSAAYGINDAGQVVGSATTTGTDTQHAFIYSNGTMSDLGTLGGTNSTAYGINDAGQVVGSAQTTGDAASHAFVSSNGTMTDLGTLGGESSTAFGINTAGRVVGTANTTINAYHAFVSSNGTMTDLGTLGTYSAATGINTAGQVVGTSLLDSSTQHAFIYSNGTMTDLGTLGGTYSQASGINTAGQVVGTSRITGAAALNAFLYRQGSLLNLNSLLDSNAGGWTLEEATAINENGQIVGYGKNPQGEMRAFLLTPPSSPVCNAAQAVPADLWSPNLQFVPVVIMGVTDPNGDAVTIAVTTVTQDEPVKGKSDKTSPDAVIQAGSSSVRAERLNSGNGRVYQISFRADDGKGGSCTGAVTVGVPLSLKKGLTAIDDGQNYDSTLTVP